jgi:hypothetical protein
MPVDEQNLLLAQEEEMSDSPLPHTETEEEENFEEDKNFNDLDDVGDELQEGHRCVSPTIPACQSALLDLIEILDPLCKNGTGHLAFTGDNVLRKCLKMM